MAQRYQDTLTITCVDADFPAWRKGRARAFAWVVEPGLPGADALIALGRRRLAGYLLERYERQPHLTVAFCGLLPGGSPLADDYTPRKLQRDLDLLRPLCRGPIRIKTAGWDTFPMVPYLAVESDWLKDSAHEALARATHPVHELDYRPHLTLGHYSGAWPLEEPLARLGAPPEKTTWRVDKLSLVSFAAADVSGPLATVGQLDLTSGSWRYSPDSSLPKRWFELVR